MKHFSFNRVERLFLAGKVAPRLRQQPSPTMLRPVFVCDRDGNIVGTTTLADVQTALLAKAQIEFSFQDGIRPCETLCEKCAAVVQVSRKGRIPRFCLPCRDKNTQDQNRSRIPLLREKRKLFKQPPVEVDDEGLEIFDEATMTLYANEAERQKAIA